MHLCDQHSNVYRGSLSNSLSSFWSTGIDQAKALTKIGNHVLSRRSPEDKHFIIAYHRDRSSLYVYVEKESAIESLRSIILCLRFRINKSFDIITEKNFLNLNIEFCLKNYLMIEQIHLTLI